MMCFWIVMAMVAAPPEGLSPPSPTVGMPAKVEGLLLPGSELEPKPIDDRMAKVILRVNETYKHGDSFRYDLTYYGVEPGDYDLRDWLRRKDGSSAADLPEIPVKVVPILPPGKIQLHDLTPTPTPWLGGYRSQVALGGAAWVAVLVLILTYRRRKAVAARRGGARRMTLADRLRPLVEAASAGRLSERDYAALERMLIGYWRNRLRLEDVPPAEVIETLKRDPQAGPLLVHLETWLHMPGGRHAPVDVARLLEPYRDLPAEPEPSGHAA